MTSEITVETVRAAGWFPGREVAADVATWEAALSSPGGYSLNEPARRFLLEFGGLTWPATRSQHRSSRFTFDLDPMNAVHEEDRFQIAEEDVGDSLFPVGEVLDGYYFLAVGASGTFYLVMDDSEPCGNDAWTAFDRLINPHWNSSSR